VSVFKKQRVHPMPLKCKHGHALTRFELSPCDMHKNHKVMVCPMRRGSKPCGDVVVLPPYGPGCDADES